MLAGWVPSECCEWRIFSRSLSLAIHSHIHVDKMFSLYAIWSPNLPILIRTPVILDWGLPLWLYANSISSLKALSPNKVILWVTGGLGIQHMNLKVGGRHKSTLPNGMLYIKHCGNVCKWDRKEERSCLPPSIIREMLENASLGYIGNCWYFSYTF